MSFSVTHCPSTSLRDYQRPHFEELRDKLLAHGRIGDFSDTGTGKTFTAIAIAKSVGQVPLVICPKSVIPAWKQAAEALGWDVDAHSYQMAARYFGTFPRVGSGTRFVWKHGYGFVIFDEVHNCKGETTQNSKMLAGTIRQGFPRVMVLSATPFVLPADLKSIGLVLGLHRGGDYREFLRQHGYCMTAQGFIFCGEEKERRAHLASIRGKLAPRTAAMRRKEIAGFPDTLIEVVTVDDETAESERLHEELFALYELRKKQGEEAITAAVQIVRNRQRLELLKVPSLVEMAKDAAETSSVCIFLNFKDSIAAVRALLPNSVEISGDVGQYERQENIQRFQSNEVPFAVVNLRAGGAGVSLHDPTGKVERTALIAPNYSAFDLVQVLGRVHRSGGAFSRQRLVYFNSPTERGIARRLNDRLGNLATVTNDDLLGKFTNN